MITCVVVPHFDHFDQFQPFLPELAATGFTLVVVDDASPDKAFNALAKLLHHQAPGSILIRHKENLGKGAAVMPGLKAALDAGFTHALQIDADGQHDAGELALFSEAAARHQDSIICGRAVFDDTVSTLRFYARHITLCFIWLETLSTQIRDALCGLRLYPLKQVVALVEDSKPGKRMAFDPEILVRAVWADINVHFIPVHVNYPIDGKSHFHYIRDNIDITWMHTRLIFGMLLRLPMLIQRNRSRNAGHSVS